MPTINLTDAEQRRGDRRPSVGFVRGRRSDERPGEALWSGNPASARGGFWMRVLPLRSLPEGGLGTGTGGKDMRQVLRLGFPCAALCTARMRELPADPQRRGRDWRTAE